MRKFAYYELVSIPNDSFNVHEQLVKNIRFEFSILYDFSIMKIFLVIPFEFKAYFENLVSAVAGLGFSEIEAFECDFADSWCIVGFPSEKESVIDDPFSRDRIPQKTMKRSILSGFFSSFDKKDCKLLVSFFPAKMSELDHERETHERELSRKQDVAMHVGTSYSDMFFGNRSSVYSKSRVDYSQTDRTQIASEIVSMCNNAKNLNDAIFRVSVVGFGDCSLFLKEQLKSKLLHIEEKVEISEELKKCVPQLSPLGEIMSGRYASKFVYFSSKCAQEKIVVDLMPLSSGSLSIGKRIGIELVSGVSRGKEICLDYRFLNRHVSITGLQGSGKSSLAMLLCRQVLSKDIPVIVITPSREWSKLAALSKNMLVFRVGEMPLNLVRCPDGVSVDVFRQELAVLLSNSVDAGPYTDPLQRVLLNAFRQLYDNKREPCLEELYSVASAAIEGSFGSYLKNGAVKFDKYGHNLISSLEYLKELKRNENFNSSGLRVEDCFKSGVVFDVSTVPKLLRPLCYSLILAQIFSYSSSIFDEGGDNELRALVVLEEAQLVFRRDAYDSASRRVSETVENELGSFRKRGIGLVVITHFPDQLSQWIWRHMQNHFVLKQDVRGAKLALEQLAFDISNYRLIGNAQAKLLKMSQREACCLLVGERKNTVGPFFMEIDSFEAERLEEDEMERRVKRYLNSVDTARTNSAEYYVLKEDEEFLRDIHEFPFSPLTKRYRRMDVYTNRGKEIKDKLVRLGLVEEISIAIGKGNYSYLAITEKGCRVLSLLGIDNLNFWSVKNVSFEHRLYQNVVGSFYISKGYDAVIEQPLSNGKFTDVAVYSKDRSKKIAIEVTLHFDNLIENVRKNIEAGFDSVLVVVRNHRSEQKVREILEAGISGETSEKVSCVLIEEFGSALEDASKISGIG